MKRDFSLKPCPFCGGNSITAEIYFPLQEFRIYCAEPDENCGAEMRLGFSDANIVGGRLDFETCFNIMEQMIEAWNRRDEPLEEE